MPVKQNLIGQKFGKLTVIKELPERKNNGVVWLCQCDCGNTTKVITSSLKNGNTKSCGCLHQKQASLIGKEKIKNLLGKKFGQLLVIEQTDKRIDGRVIWKCECDCGNLCEVSSHNLLTGNTTSCGCRKESFGVEKIKKNLCILNINFIQEYKFKECKNKRPLPFDFYLPENNCCIECDGVQHFRGWCGDLNSLKQIQNNDKIKDEYCNSNNIKLIRIPYFEWDNITPLYLLNKIRG